MAVMYPRKLLAGTQSNAERKVFGALRDLLSDEYTVFHSVPMYRQLQTTGGIGDGEIDFLLAHPKKGLLVVEVKGGGILHEASGKEWYTTDFSGDRHRIRDPFEQAKDYKYLLRDDLRACQLTRRFEYPIAHAVWFPDVDLLGRRLGLSVQIERITLDARALDAAGSAIPGLFTSALGDSSKEAPGAAGLTALVGYLAPHWEFSPTLAAKIHDENREIAEATKSQYGVLSLLSRVPRALVSGCAGSGKTILALEKAHRLAANGARVLLLCFNKKLAAWLRTQAIQRVEAHHFHGFCVHLCHEVGLATPTPDPHGDTSAFFKFELPDALMDALTQTERRYDAVIVDEAQDFLPSWWVPVQETLVDPANGTFYIFFDDNQAIYVKRPEFPFPGPLLSLTENCRNTQRIHREVAKYYGGADAVTCLGPEGRPLEILRADDVVRAVETVVKRLVHEEGLRASDITLLSPLGPSRSIIQEGQRIGNLHLSWGELGSGDTVHCSTIHAFKGLESPVILLCELDQVHVASRNELLYVGLSRARNHLVVVETDSKVTPRPTHS